MYTIVFGNGINCYRVFFNNETETRCFNRVFPNIPVTVVETLQNIHAAIVVCRARNFFGGRGRRATEVDAFCGRAIHLLRRIA